MNLEMTFDGKMKSVNEQPDQKSCHKKAKGTRDGWVLTETECQISLGIQIKCVGE